jgi:tetratricopeptide (TPR) repeat protein
MATADLSAHELLDGKYEIVRAIGYGGMGVVYLARRTALSDEVAIKCIGQARADEAARARFLREAKAMARIRHPNVVQVFDLGEHRGAPYMVMEYLRGPSLATALGKRALPWERARWIFGQICAAVEAGHRRGVVHRDLKPGNVVLAQTDAGGEVAKVLDFGLARVADAAMDARLTIPGQMMGTIAYMAPEQIEQQEATRATDVWSLGVLLYELVTGQLPFMGRSHLATMMKISEAEYAPATELVSDLPPAIVDAIARALQRNPEARPASPLELARLAGADVPPAAAAFPDDAVAGPGPTTATREAQTITAAPGHTVVAPPSVGPAANLIGREDVLAELDALRRTSGDGQPRFVALIGDTGIGKSRILDAHVVQTAIDGWKVLRGRFFAYEGDRPPPYETFQWMLGQGGASVGMRPRRQEPGAEDKWSVLGGLAERFREQAPALLALDDLQWASALDLEFLAYLAHLARDTKLTIVAAARPDADDGELATWLRTLAHQRVLVRIPVLPLGEDELRAWLAERQPDLLPTPTGIRRLLQVTRGIPLHVDEVLRRLDQRAGIDATGDAGGASPLEELSIPESAAAIVQLRIAELDPELRALLETAAVVGDEFRFESLQRAHGLDEARVEELLERAVRVRLLTDENLSPGSDYRFRDPLLREVLYASIARRQKRRLHGQVVKALEHLYAQDLGRISHILAHHFDAMGDAGATLRWSLEATRRLLAREDSDGAQQAVRRARRALDALREAGEAVERSVVAGLDGLQGRIEVRHGRPLAAEPLLRRALEAARGPEDGELRLDAGLGLGECRLGQGDLAGAAEAYERVVEDAMRVGDVRRELMARIHATTCLGARGRIDAASQMLAPALERAQALGDVRLEALALRELAWLEAKQGHVGEAAWAADRAMQAAEQCGDPDTRYRAISVRGLVAAEAGDHATAVSILREALVMARRLSLRRREALETSNLGECLLEVGRLDEAIAAGQAAVAIAVDIRDIAIEGDARVILGRMLVAAGDDEDAREMIEVGRRLCAASGRVEYEAIATVELGGIALREGQVADALACHRHALELFVGIESGGRWRAELGLARALEAARDTTAAAEHAGMARELLQDQLEGAGPEAHPDALVSALDEARAILERSQAPRNSST